MLQVGGIGAFALGLPRVLQSAAESAAAITAPRADSCILIFLNGGPSHLDTWDMKPDAPVEIRGEFKPIATSVPGVQFGEHLPRLARWMHHATVVRSVHHSVNNAHAAAVYTGLTGHDRGDATVAIGAGANDYPAIGSVITAWASRRLWNCATGSTGRFSLCRGATPYSICARSVTSRSAGRTWLGCASPVACGSALNEPNLRAVYLRAARYQIARPVRRASIAA